MPTINDLLSEIKLDELYHSSSGDPDLVIAIIDGVIDGSHSDFSSDSIKTLNDENQPSNNASCAIKDSPSCQHGTFITGILAANRQSSAPGLCPQCTFISKPLFCESASLSQCPLVDENDLADAIRQSIKAGANIINMSIGLNSRPTTLSENLSQAYNEAQKAGVLLIGASGNQASEQVNSIFQHPWVIPVAAMDPQGQIIPSSNGGPWVVKHGLMAPGNAIVSCAAGGGYQQMSGTSVAAPFVTATAALLWSQAPKADAKTIRNALLQKVSNDEHKAHSDDKLLTPKQLNGSLSLSLLRQFQSVSPQEIMPMNHHNTDTQLTSSHPKTQALRKRDSQADQNDNHNLLTNKPSDFTGLLLSCPLAAGNGVSGQTLTKDDKRITPATIAPQQCSCGDTGGSCLCESPPNNIDAFVYAAGIIKPVFANEGLRQTFYRAAQTLNVSEYDFYAVFSYQQPQQTPQRPYFYIAQQVTWILSINDAQSYIVQPKSPRELELFIDAQKMPSDTLQPTLTTIIGLLGKESPANQYSHDALPTVICNQCYNFKLDQLFTELSPYAGAQAIQDVIRQLEYSANDGITDDDRAKNFLAYRYPQIYQRTAQLRSASNSATQYFLVNITTQYVDSSSNRTIVDVIFAYQSDSSDHQVFYNCTVDVTSQYPFINSSLNQFIPLS